MSACLMCQTVIFSGTQTETYIQLAIPYLPMWLAAICLILNVLVPGTGNEFGEVTKGVLKISCQYRDCPGDSEELSGSDLLKEVELSEADFIQSRAIEIRHRLHSPLPRPNFAPRRIPSKCFFFIQTSPLDPFMPYIAYELSLL